MDRKLLNDEDEDEDKCTLSEFSEITSDLMEDRAKEVAESLSMCHSDCESVVRYAEKVWDEYLGEHGDDLVDGEKQAEERAEAVFDDKVAPYAERKARAARRADDDWDERDEVHDTEEKPRPKKRLKIQRVGHARRR